MEKITKQQAEEAAAANLAAKRAKAEIDARMKEAEELVAGYCTEHIGEFTDDRLALGTAVIAIKAGAAKPVKDGKALSTAARTQLALALPEQYVKLVPDFMALYSAEDKVVRQILRSQGVEIVREDKFNIL